MNVKQVILMRTDLNMRKGKMVSQGAHAAMAWMSKLIKENLKSYTSVGEFTMTLEQTYWFEGLFTKICLQCSSEEELLKLYDEAKAAGLTVHLITDSGLTEFAGVPTKTCIAIGPNEAEDIDKITKHLKLL